MLKSRTILVLIVLFSLCAEAAKKHDWRRDDRPGNDKVPEGGAQVDPDDAADPDACTRIISGGQVYVFCPHNSTLTFVGSDDSHDHRYDSGSDSDFEGDSAQKESDFDANHAGGVGGSTVRDPNTGHYLLFGGKGRQSGEHQTTLLQFNPDTKQFTSLTSAPIPLAYHTAVHVSGAMFVFGGETATKTTVSRRKRAKTTITLSNKLLKYTISSDTWTTMTTTSTPVARAGHTAVVHSGEIVIWGGKTPRSKNPKRFEEVDKRIYALNLGTSAWRIIAATSTAADTPAARSGHASLVIGDDMVIYGGRRGSKFKADMHAFNFPSAVWRPLELAGRGNGRGPPQRVDAVLLNCRNYGETGLHVCVVGGLRGDDDVTGIWRFRLEVTDPIKNWINVGGVRYATLDDSDFDTHRRKCGSNQFTLLPDGWSLADNTTLTHAAAMFGRWGAHCLVLDNRKAIPTRVDDYSEQSHNLCTGAYLYDSLSSGGQDQYKVTSCTKNKVMKLLLKQPGQSSDTPIANAPKITHSIVLDGIEYATIDNVPPHRRRHSTQTIPLSLPDADGGNAWSIAAADVNTRSALMGTRFTFGTMCVVVAGGAAFDTRTGEDCATGDVDLSENQLVDYGGLYAPKSRYGRILISRATSLPDTWATQYTIAETGRKRRVIRSGGTLFATIDAKMPRRSRFFRRCHDVAIKIPTGWTIASPGDLTKRALKKGRFGSKCFVLLDGTSVRRNGKPCSKHRGYWQAGYKVKGSWKKDHLPSVNQLLNHGSYYAVRYCPARILIKKESSEPYRCTSWGDPHYTTFDGVHYSYYGVGDYVLAKSTTKVFEVHTRHFRLRRASANEAVAIKHNSNLVTLQSGVSPVLKVNGATVTATSYPFDGKDTRKMTFSGGLTIRQVGGSKAQYMGRKRAKRGRARSRGLVYMISFSTSPKADLVAKIRRSSLRPTEFVIDITLDYDVETGDSTVGLCGTADGSRDNEFTDLSGSTIGGMDTAKPTHAQINNWGDNYLLVDNTTTLIGGTGYPPPRPPTETPATEPPFTNDEEKQRGRNECVDGGVREDSEEFEDCMMDIAITGDPAFAEPAADAATDGQTGATGIGNCTVAAIDMSKTVSFADRTYALLDGSDPMETQPGCQGGFISVPPGWRLAEDIAVNRAAVANFPWATSCVVLGNGVGLTRLIEECGTNMIQKIQETVIEPGTAADDGIDTESIPGGPVCASVEDCDARILIVRDAGSGPEFGEPLTETEWEFLGVNSTQAEDHEFFDGAGGGAGFYIDDPLLLDATNTWEQYGIGFTHQSTGGPSDGPVISVTHSASTGDFAIRARTPNGGARQKVILKQSTATAFSIGAWSKAEGVTGGADNDYAVFVDVTYDDDSHDYGKFGAYRVGTTEWQYRQADVLPVKPVKFIYIHLLFRNHYGTAHFGAVDVGPPSGQTGNLLVDPSFDYQSEQWQVYKKGFSFDQSTSDGLGGRGVKVRSPNDFQNSNQANIIRQSRGTYQIVILDEKKPVDAVRGLYVGGWSKSIDISGSVDFGYSIYVDVFYNDKDNSGTYGRTLNFDTGESPWTFKDMVVKLNDSHPIKAIQVVCLVRGHSGTAYFDDLSLYMVETIDASPPATSHGDPHIVTLDGHSYDLQSIGEFILTKDDDLTVQVRHSPAGSASVNSGIAVSCCKATGGGREDIVVIERANSTDSPHVLVNGESVDLGDERTLALPSGRGIITETGRLSLFPNSSALYYEIEFPVTGHKVNVEARVSFYEIQYLRVLAYYPSSSDGRVQGLLGNYNGDPNDDIVGSDGTSYDINSVTFDQLVNEFAASWKVDPSTSLFTYEYGSGPDDYTSDVNQYPVTRDNYTASEQATADAACTARGLGAGTPVYEACVLDVLATDDASYAMGSATIASVFNQIFAPLIPLPGTTPTSPPGIPLVYWTVLRVLGIVLVVAVVGFMIWKMRKSRLSKRERKEMHEKSMAVIREEQGDEDEDGIEMGEIAQDLAMEVDVEDVADVDDNADVGTRVSLVSGMKLPGKSAGMPHSLNTLTLTVIPDADTIGLGLEDERI